MIEKLLLTLTILLFALIIGIVSFLFYHQMFKKVEIRTISFQPFGFLYKSHIGNYRHNAQILIEVADYVKKSGITAVSAVTIYYQNADKLKKKQMISDVGFMVAETNYTNLPEGVEVKIIQNNHYLATSFVYKSRFSILLGAMRIYPAFRKELKSQNLAEREIIEIYDMRNKIIVYLMPCSSSVA